MIEPSENRRHAHDATVGDAQARKSALTVSVVLLLLAAWNFYRGRQTVVYLTGGAGLFLLVVGLLLPPLARGFHVFWMRVAAVLGYVNSRLLLSLLYYGVFAPYNLISRLVGRDPLNRRRAAQETYWLPRKTTRQTKEQFERLF